MISPTALIPSQFPPVLPSGLGSTRVLGTKGFVETNHATIDFTPTAPGAFPETTPSPIGQEDLPGGFKWDNILSGQSSALYSLASGYIQIDGIAVIFDVHA